MTLKIKLLALVLAVMMILCACEMPFGQKNEITETESESESVTETETETETSSESETETETETEESTLRQVISRTREEIEEMLSITDEAFTEAESLLVEFEEMALEQTDVDAINAVYEQVEDKFNYISTQVSVASIIYYIDMSDEDAYDRYYGYYNKYGDLYNSYMAHCKKVYEESPVRDELFADWTEEEIKMLLNFSPETTALTLRNDELTDELNNLSGNEFTNRSAEIYAELVTNYNKIAKLYGYDNYYEYASKEIYGRDFGQAELEAFCKAVGEQYLPKYSALYSKVRYNLSKTGKSDKDLFNKMQNNAFDRLEENYLLGYIDSLEGSMKEGMEHVFKNRNMVFASSKNSHPTAFETYLDDFEMPFCLFGSKGQSTFTMIHEIGHYYASLYNGDLVSYDLAEVQSQGNEMLLLDYLRERVSPNLHSAIESYQMYSAMSSIVVSVLIDEFERAVYSLDSVEGFGSEEFDAIMKQVCENYGGDDFIKEDVGNLYTYWRQVATNNPVYYISYALSAVEAINLYAEVEADRAAGREMYRVIIEEVTEDDTFLTALAKAGLSSPFDAETIDNVRVTVWGE